MQRFSRGLVALVVGLAVCAGAYAFGAYSHAANVWPVSLLRGFKRAVAHQTAPVTALDPFGRLLAFPGKVEAPCPPADETTGVIVVFGGSNAGNYTGQRVASASNGRVVNYLGGKCYLAASPLLGGDNTMGEYWTLLADRLVAAGTYGHVVLAVASVGDSVAADWAPGGRLGKLTGETLADVGARYLPSLLIWDMGEDDEMRGNDAARFASDYERIVSTIRSRGMAAPIYLTLATKCMPEDYPWSADNPTARAERALPSRIPGLWAGVNRDGLLSAIDRRDDCHLGATGANKMAEAWFERLKSKP